MASNGDSNYSPNAMNYQSHVMTQRERVTVFWDYENCPCPMSTKISSLAYDIKRRIDHFLGKKINKRIQLYCPMQRLHAKIRENATDLGILLMDVASKRKQESVDKRIIADIGLFAAELAESKGHDLGHIVLVSGDSDYGYILARLRDKAYIGKIMMFINDYTKDTLTQHADYTHLLFKSNLTRKENPFSEYNQRKIPPSQKITSYSYSPSAYGSHSGSYHNLNSHSNHHFALNTYNGHNGHNQHNGHNGHNGHNTSNSQWTTTYNFPYSNGTNSNNDIYGKSAEDGHGNSRRSASYHNLNAAPNSSNGKKQRNGARVRSTSPNLTHSNSKSQRNGSSKINVKSNNKDNAKEDSNGSQYVYRRKEKGGDQHLTDSTPHKSHHNGHRHVLSAPTPIPPKPISSTQSPHKSEPSNGGSGKSKPHRIVSQENLEEQLKQRQKEKEKLREKEKKENNLKRNKNKSKDKGDRDMNDERNGSLSFEISYHDDTNSAVIDGVNSKNKKLSTFTVGSLYKINESDDESKRNHKKNGHRITTKSKPKIKESPMLHPNKLDFSVCDTKKDGNTTKLSSDFFAKMIAPTQEDMDKLFKDIAPQNNIFKKEKKLNLPPKTSHIINLEKVSSSSSAPKKLLIKKRSTSLSPAINKKKETDTPIIKKKKDATSSSTSSPSAAPMVDQLRLVWGALCHCQEDGNSTPRRREIFQAMKSVFPDYMKGRDMKFAEEAINNCLAFGTVEEMIPGRISSLYVLPIILNSLTTKDSSFYRPPRSKDGSPIWITLGSLMDHLKRTYPDHLQTYFTLTYLHRTVSNATHLLAFHKDDKYDNDNDLEEQQMEKLRFRTRANAHSQQHSQQSSSVNNTTSYHHTSNNYYADNNNLTFNYYGGY